MPIHGNPGPLFQIAPRLTFLTYSWSKNEDSKYNSISKSPVNKPPLQVPQGGPYIERFPFPEPSFTYPLIKTKYYLSKSPVKEPHSLYTQRGPYIERCPFPEPSFIYPLIKTKSYLSLKAPSKRTPLHVSPTGPLYREMPVSRAFFYLSPDKNEILPFSQSPQ